MAEEEASQHSSGVRLELGWARELYRGENYEQAAIAIQRAQVHATQDLADQQRRANELKRLELLIKLVESVPLSVHVMDAAETALVEMRDDGSHLRPEVAAMLRITA